jgi:hypothetical protein
MNEIYEMNDKEYYEDFMNELMLDEYLMEKAMEKEENDPTDNFESREENQREDEYEE